MKLNRRELRKIQYDFNSVSNRLLQADFQDYLDVLTKFLNFIKNTPIVFDYIVGCGKCTINIEEEVTEVQGSYGQAIFSVGDTDEEEVRNVFAILQYIIEKQIQIQFGIARGYSYSNKFQDMIKGFNERFVMILIRHVEGYLTKVGIDMGLDEKVVYNVTVHDGQAIIATDGATVSATNTAGLAGSDLDRLLEAVRQASQSLLPEDREAVAESLEVIAIEAKAEKPKKSMLKAAMTTLKGLTGVAEFVTAVGTLATFLQAAM